MMPAITHQKSQKISLLLGDKRLGTIIMRVDRFTSIWDEGKEMKTLKKGLGRRTGQAMIEYLIIAAMLLATIPMMAIFLRALRQHSTRTLELAASEYP
jgi:hypothetical protein